MNTGKIKSYAPKARKNFIAAISKQAAKYGITECAIEPITQKGDVVLIGERPFSASIIRLRAALVQKIEQLGFNQVIEHVAYSWFNRLCAIRYMELKDYLEHGRRVLSHPTQSGSYQIVDDCLDIELAGLDKNKVHHLAHVNKLEQDKEASNSTTDIKKLEKEITVLHKQQAELSTFDEKLRHYADQRITLDLDDGVKVNYGKFGDLLA